jgi:hypothetical protein
VVPLGGAPSIAEIEQVLIVNDRALATRFDNLCRRRRLPRGGRLRERGEKSVKGLGCLL